MSRPAGVYRTNPPGCLLVVHSDPITILCLRCNDVLNLTTIKGTDAVRAALAEFRKKHGVMSERIADHLGELWASLSATDPLNSEPQGSSAVQIKS